VSSVSGVVAKGLAVVPSGHLAGGAVAPEIALRARQGKPWRVVIRRVSKIPPQTPGDLGDRLDQRIEWHSHFGGLALRVSVTGDQSGSVRRWAEVDLDVALGQIARAESTLGWEWLRFGWSVEAVANRIGSACFHPTDLDEWMDRVVSDGLVRVQPIEIVDGPIEDIAIRLWMDRLSLWRDPEPVDGSLGVYAIGRADSGSSGLLVARFDAASVRVVVQTEGSDATDD